MHFKSYTMKKLLFLLSFVICIITNAQNYQWAFTVGGSSASYNDLGNDIYVDTAGNSYAIGQFSGTADFEIGRAHV